MKNPLRFRRATEPDLDRIVEIHVTAFPDDRGPEERRRNFTASLYGALEDLVVAEEGEEIVGQAFLTPMRSWFGGRLVTMGGIASVSIAPEARGQGVATALMNHLHVASDMRGDALTMLYAFREAFYARLGYGKTSMRKRLMFDPAVVPNAWRGLARERVRRVRGVDRDAIMQAYARAGAKKSGWLARDEGYWVRHLARERRQFLVADHLPTEGGGLAGYVAFEIRQRKAHGKTSIVVDELAADDDVTRLALIGAMAALRDQVADVVLEVADDDPLALAFLDPDQRRYGTSDVEHSVGTVVGGPMVRIDDVTRAIEARGYHVDGGFDLVVVEGEGDGGSAIDELAVRVEVSGGRAEVSAARGAAGALRASRTTLASLLYGGLRVTDALRLGLAFADPKVLSRVDAILAIAPVSPIDPF